MSPDPYERSRGSVFVGTAGCFAIVLSLGACASSGAACVSSPAAPPTARSPEPATPKKTFATPEAAVEHYVKSVASNDLIVAMQAYSVDDYAPRFDFARRARYIGILLVGTLDAPSNYGFYVQMNKLGNMAIFAQATKLFAYGFLSDWDTNAALRASEAEVAAFIKEVDPARLASLRIVRIDQPMKSVTSGEEARALAKQHAAQFGAEDLTERVVLYELGGVHYWSGFRLVRYPASWRISEFSANYGGRLPERGIVGKTTLAEYEARL